VWQSGSIYDYQDSLCPFALGKQDSVVSQQQTNAYFTLKSLPFVDVLVVLTGGKGRIAAGVDLLSVYRQGMAQGTKKPPLLYIAGVTPGTSFSDLFLSSGVAPADVFLEFESTNTRQNAEQFVKQAQVSHWKEVCLITSPYHMKRAALLFTFEARKRGIPLQLQLCSVWAKGKVKDKDQAYFKENWFKNARLFRLTVMEFLKIQWFLGTSSLLG
jgi:uncharacterized SAM-binding protein YcdF (DUF218 family)